MVQMQAVEYAGIPDEQQRDIFRKSLASSRSLFATFPYPGITGAANSLSGFIPPSHTSSIVYLLLIIWSGIRSF